MSGIAGIIDLPHDEHTVQSVLHTLIRRGPGEKGVYKEGRCCICQTCWEAPDTSAATIPFCVERPNEKYLIVFDGKIYNARELKDELAFEGIVFPGCSDMELVLYSYIHWGEKCLEKINGVFAFGIWKTKAQTLFIARDRMGVKPLFYACLNDGFVFGSEIKTVLSYPGLKPRLNSEGIAQLLLLGPGRVPGSGVFCDVLELEPGECGEYAIGTFRKHRYWHLKDRIHRDSFAETADKVRFLVTDSIKRQMASASPVGCLLSGGLDSSIIASVCAENLKSENNKLRTFSVDYLNNAQYFTPGKFQPERDAKYIEIMREYIQSEHCQVTLSTQDLAQSLEDAVCARDLPGMADVDSSLLKFCGEIRKWVDVAISGECSDEIFGGYPWYRDPEIRAQEGFPWSQNIEMRSAFINPEHIAKLNPKDYVMDHYRATIDSCDILPGTSRLERRMKEMMCLNIRWFMQTLLDRNDRMSMYHNLEVRAPFCDYRIVEYMYGVPWEFKDYNGREKGLLRYAMKDILPDEIVTRKKSPYPKTYDPAYCDAVSSLLLKILDSKDEPILHIVNKSALKQLMESNFTTPWYGQLMALPQTMAYMVQLNFWLKKYNVAIQ